MESTQQAESKDSNKDAVKHKGKMQAICTTMVIREHRKQQGNTGKPTLYRSKYDRGSTWNTMHGRQRTSKIKQEINKRIRDADLTHEKNHRDSGSAITGTLIQNYAGTTTEIHIKIH